MSGKLTFVVQILTKRVQISLPDELLTGVQVTLEDLPFELALGLFVDNKASLGQAARISGMSTPAFLHELGMRNICVHYDEDDLASDIRLIKELSK